MNLIQLDRIKISENRQRREFRATELQELADSIRTRGLYHPIVLRIEGEDYQLVSGERRLRAVTMIYDLDGSFSHDGAPVRENCIPYTSLGDLSLLEAEEAELEENIRRVDLTWQERASATARLGKLRADQARARGEGPPATSTLSDEVRGVSAGDGYEATKRELAIARHLADPEVRAAKSLDEAWKLLQRKEASAKHAALGELVGKTFTADVHAAINQDACEWLRSASAESFDVILTDPPYGMGADSFGDSGGLAAGAHAYTDDEATFNRLMDVFVPMSIRITKPAAHLYLFCDIDRFFDLRLDLSHAGWQVFRTPLIWYKKSGMRAPLPEHGPQRKYECILYAIKGKKPVRFMAGDVLDFSPDSNLGHAAQKPVALFVELLKRSVQPGDSVLDPFMGSGTIFPAAHELKCKATGVELDTASYGIAVKRIEDLKKQLELKL